MKIAVIDSHGIGHAVKHSLAKERKKGIGRLSYNGFATDVIYGFLRKVFSLWDDFAPDVFVFCWDSVTGYERSLVYPAYKNKDKKKDKTDEEREMDKIVYTQFTLLREAILPGIGFGNVLYSAGLEADDLIAQVALDYKYSHDIIIVSRDEDLYQLLDKKRVRIFNPITRKFYFETDLREEYGIGGEEWGLVKAIAGCDGDNVGGIVGVAEKTAAKFLRGELKENTKAFQSIEAGQKLIENNLELVLLPWKTSQRIKLEPDSIETEQYKKLCQGYGMRSLLTPDVVNKYVGMMNTKEL